MPKIRKSTGSTGSSEVKESRLPAPTCSVDPPEVVTYSELDAYRQCPLKHKWSYKDRWVKPPQVGSALSRGSLWHLVLECHYTWLQRFPKNRHVTSEFLHRWVRENLLFDEAGNQNEDQELVDWMYEGYLECYGLDPDWELVQIEQANQTALPAPEGSRKFLLRMKNDLLIRSKESGQLWLVDHKSASQFTRQAEIDVDDQFGLYTWALRQLGYPVVGTIRSDARTQRNKGDKDGTKLMPLEERFRRVMTYRTQEELDHIARDAYATASAAWGDTPLHSSPAPDRCSWRCDFLQAHLMYRKGVADEATILGDFGFSVNPRKHREYETDAVLDRIAPKGTKNPHEFGV